MDKIDHGRMLKAAMARSGHNRQTVAAALDVKVRTVTNWTSGTTMPTAGQQETLRRILGDYDDAGDPVESALRKSELDEWRQDTVIGFYKRHLHEQRGEAAG